MASKHNLASFLTDSSITPNLRGCYQFGFFGISRTQHTGNPGSVRALAGALGGVNSFQRLLSRYDTPRLMLSEPRDVTQALNITFRTPTGDPNNRTTSIAAATPNDQFWANWWQGLVVRGGAGFFIPYSGDLNVSGARSLFNANLAAGDYFTPHDFTPIGDMVWFLSTNFNQTIDDRGPSRTLVTLSPGFRTHMGMNWYLHGAVEVPVTRPQPYDYQVLGGIMKVF